jgi:hypothetical protein
MLKIEIMFKKISLKIVYESNSNKRELECGRFDLESGGFDLEFGMFCFFFMRCEVPVIFSH